MASAYVGARSIVDKAGRDLRLQIGPVGVGKLHSGHLKTTFGARYRFVLQNAFHCGHWHRTPEDALSCLIAKGVEA